MALIVFNSPVIESSELRIFLAASPTNKLAKHKANVNATIVIGNEKRSEVIEICPICSKAELNMIF